MESVHSNQQEEAYTPHEIFLSHSGKQKPFVKDLYDILTRSGFTTFLDIEHHSLPIGESFPKRIDTAARGCRLAVVVLSNDFVSSKWPMLELSTFVEAGVKIVPLFFKLLPSDLKNPHKLNTWKNEWDALAKVDPRIDVSKWQTALKHLRSQNGLSFDEATEGEFTYINRIVESIHNSQFTTPHIQRDLSHIRGKDRMCKIILSQLTVMESNYKQGVNSQHVDLALPSSSSFPQAAQSNITCVLGVYGIQGSGKSTICKCLPHYFSPMYGGRSLYLELPTNPSQADLVHKFKDLLQLTDFRNRLNLDHGVNELEEVVCLLKQHQLSRCRVFLVVDNISETSLEEVKRILLVGVAPGSKVILAARTLDILHPLLELLGDMPSCICDSMSIPTINKKEATEILLQTARAGKLEQHLTAKQKDILSRIVQMCGFCEEYDKALYLPLVMKTMGALLIRYNEDFEKWGNDQEYFWTEVKGRKEDAVNRLVEQSFKALPSEKHQLLFLDVVHFIVPSNFGVIDEAYRVLGFMHETSAPTIKDKVKDLQRLCFLTVTHGEVRVHDVYSEFAKRFKMGFMGLCWRDLYYPAAETPRVLVLKGEGEENLQVRTMILELGEACDKVDLQGFSRLKALVVRSCKSLVALGMAGLSSLVSLDIENCASLQQLECRDISDLLDVKRLNISPLHVQRPENMGQKRRRDCNDVSLLNVDMERTGKKGRVLRHAEQWAHVPYLSPFMNVLRRMLTAPAKQPKSFEVAGIARHMRGLQVLRLERTGIKRVVDMSSCWPQLQDLTVIESELEEFEVGSLPQLRRIQFSDHGSVYGRYWGAPDSVSYHRRIANEKSNPRMNLQGRDLLLGCSSLEQLDLTCSHLEKDDLGSLPPNLKLLFLNCFYSATELPDFASSAHALEEIQLVQCEKLERVDLRPAGLKNLRSLRLYECHSLVEVIIGSDSMPSLQQLHVQCCRKLRTLIGFDSMPSLQLLYVKECGKLRTLIGFDNARMLESLVVMHCPELQEISCLPRVSGLKCLIFRNAPNLGSADIENLRDLRQLVCSIREPISLRKLGNLVILDLRGYHNDEEEVCLKSAGIGEAAASDLDVSSLADDKKPASECLTSHSCETVPYLDFSSLVGLEPADDDNSPTRTFLPSIDTLSLSQVNVLAGMDCIQHLRTLTSISLESLNVLRRVQGIEYLIHLHRLNVSQCPLLEDMPSLHTLVNLTDLEISYCPKLKAVEGCSDEMKGLETVKLEGCESMARFIPFTHLYGWSRGLQELSFAGCEFARDNIDAMVAWVVDTEAPITLRRASLHQLAWEYYHYCPGVLEKGSLLEAVFARLLPVFLPNDDDDISQWKDECINSILYRVVHAAPAMQALGRRLAGKPKMAELVQHFQAYKQAVLDFLDDANVAELLSGKHPWTFLTMPIPLHC